MISVDLEDWLLISVRHTELTTDSESLISLFAISMCSEHLSQYLKFRDHSCQILLEDDDSIRAQWWQSSS